MKILDFNEAENKLIVSEKAIQDEAAKEELAKLKIGEVVEGEITEVTDFGAFVKLSDMLDGLIHSSEIDWRFIEDPREILTPGDKVKAKIISLDGGRISLSLKALKDDPWTKIEGTYQPGQTVKGKATKVRNNGVFVELPGEIIAFLPSSELGEKNPAEMFEAGKEYDLTIVSLDIKEHKMVLTIPKKLDEVS